jgi:cell division protein FtsI (penicillin-binding protein 3)
MNLRKIILTRFGILVAFLLLFSVGIVIKVVVIQVAGGEKWGKKLRYIKERTEVIYGNRGNVCSHDGKILATSVPYYQIRFDLGAPAVRKTFASEVGALSVELSRLYGDRSANQFRHELETAYKKKARYYLVHPRKINYEELKRARKFPIFERGKNKGGFMPEPEYVRVMPYGSMALRTVGLLSKDASGKQGNVGISGIEKKYEEYLRGEEGLALQQNLSGRWISIITDEPDNGKDVVTTIDLYMQDVVENSLRKQLNASQAEWGTAVLMEVETGKIRAISNLGRTKNGYREIYNYAIGHEGCLEPGSTFKLVSLMVAMDDGLVDTSDVVDIGEGKWKFFDQTIYDSDYGEGGTYGKLTMKQIFERSSNVGVAKIIYQGYKGREKKFIENIYGLGLNEKLDIGLQGEAQPSIKHPNDKNWWGNSMVWISYGYEIRISPLQLLALYNAIANDGKMMKPQFVEAIAENGEIEKTYGTEVLKYSICSNSTLRKIQKMLEGVVERGTASNIKTPRYKIAGKTGTAKVAEGNKGYSSSKYRGSFVGYFPADNPRYSCVVVISEPTRGSYYGGYTAAPVFKEIADCVYGTDLSVQMAEKQNRNDKKLPSVMNGLVPETKLVCKELDIRYKSPKRGADYVSTIEGEKSVEMKGRKLTEGQMPNVLGMGAVDAIYLIEKAGLTPRMSGVGRVLRQSPQPGANCKRGQTVLIELS